MDRGDAAHLHPRRESRRARAGREHAAAGVWISSVDIVADVLSQCATHAHPDAPRPYALAFTLNLRGRLPAVRARAQQDGFVGFDAVQVLTDPTPLATVRAAPLAVLVAQHRAAIRRMDDPQELAAHVGVFRRAAQAGQMLLLNKVKGHSYQVTNWEAGAYAQLDFGGGGAKVLFVGGACVPRKHVRRNWAIVLGRDGPGVPEAERGVWIFSIPKWPAVEAYLKSL